MTFPKQPQRGRPVRRTNAHAAFTLVELLTVVAVIGVLATLLLTALQAAQKRSRQARCAGNLHQIGLAIHMYLDDFPRPQDISLLVRNRYLANRDALICPQDRTTNWGNLVAAARVPALPAFGGSDPTSPIPPSDLNVPDPGDPILCSYVHPLPWDDVAWGQLLKAGSLAGMAACQVHGLGQPNLQAPSVLDFEGLVLRAQRDGAVVRRKVFWASTPAMLAPASGTDTTQPSSAGPSASATLYPWPLFLDELPP